MDYGDFLLGIIQGLLQGSIPPFPTNNQTVMVRVTTQHACEAEGVRRPRPSL